MFTGQTKYLDALNLRLKYWKIKEDFYEILNCKFNIIKKIIKDFWK